MNKTLEALRRMEEVIDKMTPEEVLALIEKYKLSPDIIKEYATLERMIRKN